MRRRISSLLVVLTVPTSLVAQQVTGRVTDQRSGAPLAAVQVFIAGSGIGALTQQNGRYLLLNVPAGTHTVTAERIGYGAVSTQITVSAGATLVQDFAMSEEALGLDEIVVTGVPGGTRRRAVGNVVGTVDAASATINAPIAGAENLLAGRTPGVTLSASQGNVGAGSNVRVRGVSTLSLNENPLIYIDGVRVNNSESQSGGGGNVSRLNDISPNEIASIEVLKGPSAATLYGTDASQGVINIITKRGAAGAARVDMSVRQGSVFFIRPEKIFPTNYWTDPQTGQVHSLNIMETPEGQTVFQNGHLQEYTASMTGGTESVLYYIGGSYVDEEGVVASGNNFNQKINVRSNIDLRVNEKVTVSAGAGFIKNDLGLSDGHGATRSVVHAWPLSLEENRCRVLPGVSCAYYRGWSDWGGTPEALEAAKSSQHVIRSVGTLSVSYQPVGWLSNRVILGYDATDQQDLQLMAYQTDPAIRFMVGQNARDGYRDQRRTRTFNTTFDAASTAEFQLTEALGSATSIGSQYYGERTEFARVRGERFPGPGLETIEATGSQPVATDTYVENSTLGFYLQEVLNWRDRIFLTGAVRVDNNSAFGDEIRWVTYPKASLSWVVDEEPAFADVAPSWVSSLRLRGAWGQSGTQPPSFVALRTFGFVPGPAGQSGVSPSTLGNPDLRPEVGDEIEGGFDLGLLDERVAVQFTYYRKNTKDAILLRANAPSLGFPGSRYVNAGLITNSGLELQLDASIVSTPSVQWDVSANFSTNDAELKRLSGQPGDTAVVWNFQNSMEHRVGYAPSSYFGPIVVSAGWDPTTRTAIDPRCDDGRGGTMLCYDANRNVVAPRVYQGRAIPPRTGGISSDVTLWSSLQIHAMAEWQQGHHRYDNTTRIRCHLFPMCYQNHYPEEKDAVLIAQYKSGDRLTGYTIQDASFLRLREVSLSYTLSEGLVERLGLSRAVIQVAGRNLMTFTRWTGLDPETMYSSSEGRPFQEQHRLPHPTRFETTLRVGL